MQHRRSMLPLLTALTVPALALTSGCVRRTLTINTEPQGAVVWLNDEEIGTTPVTTDFLWYGDYDVVARRRGYQTLRTHDKIDPPWYQLPGIDLISEALYPGWIVDARSMHFELRPEQLPSRDQLLENARRMRENAFTDAASASPPSGSSNTQPAEQSTGQAGERPDNQNVIRSGEQPAQPPVDQPAARATEPTSADIEMKPIDGDSHR